MGLQTLIANQNASVSHSDNARFPATKAPTLASLSYSAYNDLKT